MRTPLPEQHWRHKNGNLYRVLMRTNIGCAANHKYPETVVYVNIINGNVFSRFLHDWHTSMMHELQI